MIALYLNDNGTITTGVKRRKAVIGSGADKQPASFASSKSAPNFTYQGGLTIKKAEFYNIYIGNWSSQDDQLRAQRLTQFIKDLTVSNWMTTMNEYGFVSGVYKNSFFIPNTDDNLDGSKLVKLLQGGIDSNIIPEPTTALDTDSVYCVYLDDNTAITDDGIGIAMCEPKSDTAFAYHHLFNTKRGNNFFYAVIPYLNDTCVGYSCAGKTSCSLNTNLTVEQRQTQVTSHEIAETITNPDGNGWYDMDSGDETGDTCNGRSTTITVGQNTWTVQKIFSQKENLKTNGDTTCVASSSGTGTDYIPPSKPTTSLVSIFGANTVPICQVVIAASFFGIVSMLIVNRKK